MLAAVNEKVRPLFPIRARFRPLSMNSLKAILIIALRAVVFVVSLFVVVVGISILTGKLAGPITWRFPDGFRGWVVMEFHNQNVPR